MDDVLVETEDKKQYNKIMEEILKRMEKNNLYIKLEKCI